MKTTDRLFTLRIPLHDGSRAIITAFDVIQYREDGTRWTHSTHHHAITFRVVHVKNGKRTVVWKPGQTWDGIAGHMSIDGNGAKEHVLSHVALKPGDTDEEFFDDYTPEQLAFIDMYSDDISIEREARYCDPETGACRY